MKRRDFLGASAAALLAPRYAFAQEGYRRLLVLIELKGGNDGLNSVIPYADANYRDLRPRLAVPRDQVLQLDETAGLHPALKPLLPLWQARELAIVQGVGYPDPNLSHFRSIEIWNTASRSDEYLPEGWLARAFAARPVPAGYAADGVVVGGNDMGPLAGPGTRVIVLSQPEQFLRQAKLVTATGTSRNAALGHILRIEADIVQAASRLDGGAPLRTQFPKTAFGNAVRIAAGLAANPAGVAAIRLSLDGFDTHQGQANVHARLLGELAEGIAALKAALTEIGRWDSTLVMTYAEFGRRARENHTGGTDHGTASAHFVTGGRVRGGLYGARPNFSDLDGGNLRFALDFRCLYATALEKWWGTPGAQALGGRYEALDLLRA